MPRAVLQEPMNSRSAKARWTPMRSRMRAFGGVLCSTSLAYSIIVSEVRLR